MIYDILVYITHAFRSHGGVLFYKYLKPKALGKLGNIVAETLFPTNASPCFPGWANTRKH
jgi:hypothetical protein